MFMMPSRSKSSKKHGCGDLSEGGKWNEQRQLFSRSPLSSHGKHESGFIPPATISPSAEANSKLQDKSAGRPENQESDERKHVLDFAAVPRIKLTFPPGANKQQVTQLEQLDMDGQVSDQKYASCRVNNAASLLRNFSVPANPVTVRGLSDNLLRPTEKEKTNFSEECGLSTNGSDNPWNNNDVGNVEPGDERTKRNIAVRTSPMGNLDPRYKIHGSKKFKFGQVFKVLWSEPIEYGSPFIVAKHQYIRIEKELDEIRRIIIVAFGEGHGHSMCLPIKTYSGQGTSKHGVTAEDHALIYATKKTSEQRSLLSKHIPKATSPTTNKLDPISRLNYAKLYTLEHDVQMRFIGKGDGKSIDHDPDLDHGTYINQEEPSPKSDRVSDSTSKVSAIGVPIIPHWKIPNRPLSNNLGSSLYRIELVKTSDWPDNQAAEKAIEVLEGWKLFEKNGELFLVLGGETCNCDNIKYSPFKHLTRAMTSPKALGGLGMGSGLLMSVSFLWLNKRMELSHASSAIRCVMETAARNFPVTASNTLGLIPDGVIFAIFVFTTAILTGTTFAWMTNKTQKPGAKAFGWAVAGILSVSCMFAAVTIEEFLLVCLPLSVGFGILSSCFLGQKGNKELGAEKLVCEV